VVGASALSSTNRLQSADDEGFTGARLWIEEPVKSGEWNLAGRVDRPPGKQHNLVGGSRDTDRNNERVLWRLGDTLSGDKLSAFAALKVDWSAGLRLGAVL
jgi:hypothetical protein